MTINPVQVMQILAGGNSQQMVINLLQDQAKDNPILMNLLQMAGQGNVQGIEQVARNIVNSQGLDYNTEFLKFKQSYGLI